jgi:hypothetical protein
MALLLRLQRRLGASIVWARPKPLRVAARQAALLFFGGGLSLVRLLDLTLALRLQYFLQRKTQTPADLDAFYRLAAEFPPNCLLASLPAGGDLLCSSERLV